MNKQTNNFRKIKFTEIDSNLKDMKEFVVTYECDGKLLRDVVLVDKAKGLSKKDYLRLAEKEFKSKSPTTRHKGISNTPLKIVAGCAGVAAITFASLFTWKMLINNPEVPGPTPGGDTYTVTWDLGNGEVVKEEYKVGETPSYKGEIPSKPDDTEYDEDGMKYHYTFDGWEETISPVAKDVTYHTHYIKESLFLLIKGYVLQSDIESGESKYHIDELADPDEESAWEVDWGDGDMSIDHDLHEHTYTTPGYKIIKIHNKCTSIHFSCDDPEQFAYSKKFIKEVTIPYGVKRIPAAFETSETAMFGATRMNKVTFPSSLVSMTNIFCNNVESMTFDPATIGEIILPNKLKKIEEQAFSGIGNYRLPLAIPNTVTEISEKAFYKADIGRLVLPKTINSYPSKSLYLSSNYHTIDMTDYDTAPEIVSDTFNNTAKCLYRIIVKANAYQSFLTKWASIGLDNYIVAV